MNVLEIPVARPTQHRPSYASPVRDADPPLRLAPAITIAAAVGGVVELLLERVAGPILTHAAGPSLAPVAAMASNLGTLVVSVTAVLVLLAAVAWAGVAWESHRIVGAAIVAAAPGKIKTVRQ